MRLFQITVDINYHLSLAKSDPTRSIVVIRVNFFKLNQWSKYVPRV